MIEIGVQTQNVLTDESPKTGFGMIREAGFTCVDFSLHSQLTNKDVYKGRINTFFDQTTDELKDFFKPHKLAAMENGIKIHQMHMPYPIYVPTGEDSVNEYMRRNVAPKSLEVCAFLDCKYIVIHGFKLAYDFGTEYEYQQTEDFLNELAPIAKELQITMCVENLYDGLAGHLLEGPCCNVRRTVEMIDRLNDRYKSEVLGFCFDTGHANLVGLDFEKFLTALGHRLKVLHIHDNDGVCDLHQIPFTFTKTRENTTSTDWQGFIAGLKNIHFDKVLSFETGPVLNTFPEALKLQTLTFIAQIGTFFAKELEA